MPNATQKDLQVQTENLAKLIKSEIGGLRSEFKTQFKFQRQELESYIDEKFETNRRLLVDEMQNFQDAIIAEVKAIKQETSVNSSHRNLIADHETRITKVERHLFSN